MKRLIGYSILLAFGSAMTGCATPQPGVYSYPARGQAVEQVSRDQAECQAWAKQQTGFHPAMDTAKGAGVGAAIGALGGAAAGAAVGAAAGNAGKGAAIGAAAGGLGGAGVGAAVGYAKSKDGYDKAYAVCMSARGYAVTGQPQAAAPASAPAPPPPPQVVAAAPPVVIQSPPQLVVVPGTPVYYAPGLNVNFFYYGGQYYTLHNNAWFVATAYNGPWAFMAVEYVPQPVLAVPVQYYKVPPGHWKKHGPPPWAGPKKWKDD